MMKSSDGSKSVAVIGAGLAGLTCADRLSKAGYHVRVFDKGRRPGGRMSTRETRNGLKFDHGCQYFSAKSADFRKQVKKWQQAGVVAQWEGRFVAGHDGILKSTPASSPHFVGCPAMQTICGEIGKSVQLNTAVRITEIKKNNDRWQLQDEHNTYGPFDMAIVAIPPQQVSNLLPEALKDKMGCDLVQMTVCWTAMVAFNSPVDADFDAANIFDRPLSWIARNSSKPGRDPTPDCWVLQASHEWSETYSDMASEQVCTRLLQDFSSLVSSVNLDPIYERAHRWLYAIPIDSQPFVEPQYHASEQLGICGDWRRGSRVEDAWLSGLQLADSIIAKAGR